MRTLRMTFMYIRRGVVSWRFICCTFISTVLMFVFVYLDYINSIGSALYYFYLGVENSGSVYFLIMLTSMPSILMFCDDWRSGMFDALIARSGRKCYAFSLVFGSSMVSSLSVLLSYVFFSLLMITKFPIVPAITLEELRDSTIGMVNSGLLLTNPILFYMFFVLNKMAVAALFTAVGIVISTLITDVHLTVVVPILLNTVFGIIASIIQPPFWLDLRIIFGSGAGLYLGFGGDLAGSLFSVISAVYPFAFSFFVVIMLFFLEIKAIRLKEDFFAR